MTRQRDVLNTVRAPDGSFTRNEILQAHQLFEWMTRREYAQLSLDEMRRVRRTLADQTFVLSEIIVQREESEGEPASEARDRRSP